MSVIELIMIGISLSMDAFAVSICKGLSVGKIKPKHMITAGLWFGGFQALMPLIGYLLGSTARGHRCFRRQANEYGRFTKALEFDNFRRVDRPGERHQDHER